MSDPELQIHVEVGEGVVAACTRRDRRGLFQRIIGQPSPPEGEFLVAGTKQLREALMNQEGWLLPSIRFTDNNKLPPNGVRILSPIVTQVYELSDTRELFAFLADVGRYVLRLTSVSKRPEAEASCTRPESGYPVFISFKNLDADGQPTRDSTIAQEVYQHLCSQGIQPFFSIVTLERLGAAAYKRAIDDALDKASVLVAVSTSPAHLESEWVRYEWDSFLNDILSGSKKGGRIFVYVESLSPRQLPRGLRQWEMLTHSEESLNRLCRFIKQGL